MLNSEFDVLLGPSSNYSLSSSLLIAGGVLFGVTIAFVCYVRIRCKLLTDAENVCFASSIVLSSVIVGMVFLVGGIVSFQFRDDMYETLDERLEMSIKDYVNNTSIKQAWDDLQQAYECCGLSGPSDWDEIPKSCCKVPNSCNVRDRSAVFQRSCRSHVLDIIQKRFIRTAAVGLTFGILVISNFLCLCIGLLSVWCIRCAKRSSMLIHV